MFANSPRALALVGLLAASACHFPMAPRRWLPPADASVREAFGGWADVMWRPDTGSRRTRIRTSGELIAAHDDTLYILRVTGELAALPLAFVLDGSITSYDARTSTMIAWGTLGTLATASHGIVLLLTAPVWIISSSVAASSVSRAARVVIRRGLAERLRPYARFPQGIPAGVDVTTLRPKPVPSHR